MAKEKKISANYFLNKKLKPQFNEDGEALYPIYIQVNFDGKNNQFSISWDNYFYEHRNPYNLNNSWNDISYVSENDFDYIIKQIKSRTDAKFVLEDNHKIFEDREILINIFYELEKHIIKYIGFELKLNNGKINFRGFGKRINLLIKSVIEDYNNHVVKLLKDDLKKLMSKNQFKLVSNKVYVFEIIDFLLGRPTLLNKINSAVKSESEAFICFAFFVENEPKFSKYSTWIYEDLDAYNHFMAYLNVLHKIEHDKEFYLKYIENLNFPTPNTSAFYAIKIKEFTGSQLSPLLT